MTKPTIPGDGNKTATQGDPGTPTAPAQPFQAPQMFPLQNFSFDQISSGALNPISDNRSTSLLVATDPSNPFDSIFKYIEDALSHSNRLSSKTKWTAMVIRNDTSPHPDESPYGTLRETTFDPIIRASGTGAARGCVRVLIPELHSHLPRPSAIANWHEPVAADLAITELYPRAFGPAEYLRNFVGGELVEVEFINPNNFNDATIVLPASATPPGPTKIQDSKSTKPSPRRAANSPTSRPTFRAPASKLPTPTNPLDKINRTGQKTLELPEPKKRPSPKTKGLYHTSVDKSLIVGPSPYGLIDWAGCGGYGTCAQAPGKPKSGRKKYYLKGNEADDKGPLLVTLPAEYSTHGRPMKIHRCTLGPYLEMIKLARADGIPAPIFKVYSTWRSLKQQDRSFKKYFYGKYGGSRAYGMYDKRNAKAYRACRKYNGDPFAPGQKPGGDHYSGRGIDMFLGFNQNRWSDAYQRKNGVGRVAANKAFKRYMHSLNVFKWLQENAEFFGFYNYSREPWHWAFNPDDRPNRSDTPPEFPE